MGEWDIQEHTRTEKEGENVNLNRKCPEAIHVYWSLDWAAEKKEEGWVAFFYYLGQKFYSMTSSLLP